MTKSENSKLTSGGIGALVGSFFGMMISPATYSSNAITEYVPPIVFFVLIGSFWVSFTV